MPLPGRAGRGFGEKLQAGLHLVGLCCSFQMRLPQFPSAPSGHEGSVLLFSHPLVLQHPGHACTVPMGTGAKFWTPLLAQSRCPHTQFMPWAHIPNIIPVTLIPSSLGHSSCPLLLVLLEQGPCRVVIRGCLQLLLHSTRVDCPRSMLTQRWPNYSLSTVGFIRVSLSIFYFSNR